MIESKGVGKGTGGVGMRQEQARAGLMQRHEHWAKLEVKAGVRKGRMKSRSFTATPYGSSRHYATPSLYQRLSRSRCVPNPDSSNDIRGLLHVDHPEVISRLHGHSESTKNTINLTDYQSDIKDWTCFPPEDVKTWSKEMDEFCEKEMPPQAASQVAFLKMIKGK